MEDDDGGLGGSGTCSVCGGGGGSGGGGAGSGGGSTGSGTPTPPASTNGGQYPNGKECWPRCSRDDEADAQAQEDSAKIYEARAPEVVSAGGGGRAFLSPNPCAAGQDLELGAIGGRCAAGGGGRVRGGGVGGNGGAHGSTGGTTGNSGRLVIGKLSDLGKPGTVRPGEFRLTWQDRGNPKANWTGNSSRLRAAMSQEIPIRDASINPTTGALQNNTGFLRAERNMMQNAGWEYQFNATTGTGYWYPPMYLYPH